MKLYRERRAVSKTVSVMLVVFVLAVVGSTLFALTTGDLKTRTTTTSSVSSTSSSSSSTSSSSAGSATAFTVMVANSTKLGSYLVNGTGFTLYFFAPDTVGNSTSPPVSACGSAESCITVWPPFYAAHIVVPPGLNASDFTTFTRPDGTNQTAYMGHPLYYFVSDTGPGVVSGNAININGGYWYVASVNGTLG